MKGQGTRRSPCLIGAFLLTTTLLTQADLSTWTQDPLHVGLPAPATAALPERAPVLCGPLSTTSDLSLMQAVTQSLCHNPKTQAAALAVVSKNADVGVAKAAYLPTLNGTVQNLDARLYSYYPTQSPIDNSFTSRYQDYSLNLSWLLYDFGARQADLRQARELLEAARADQDATVLEVMGATVKDYYDALAYAAAVQAAQTDVADAEHSVAVAQQRVIHGVAPISDALQAQTAAAQAQLSLSQATRNREVARGALAVDMGLSPTTGLHLQAMTAENMMMPMHLDEALHLALQQQPKLRSAQAQIAAAQAHRDQIRDAGRPSLRFVAKGDRNSDPQTLGLGSAYVPARARSVSFALELDVPFFEGFVRTYQERSADADVQVQQAKLDDLEQQVRQNVWSAYEDLQASHQNLTDAQQLLDVAQQAEAAARQRYEHGAAGILELLSTQTTLSDARRQSISALAQALNARLQLANAVGVLGF